MQTRSIILALLLAGCGNDQPGSQPPADSTTLPAATSPDKAAPAQAERVVDRAPFDSAAAHPGVALLRAVRVAAHDTYDRITFEFEGPLPPYKVSYTDVPVSACGSGEPVELPGTAILSVRFSPANAHTEAGEASGAPRELKGPGGNILALRQVCDFEAVVQWVVALERARRYTVRELAAPARVVVDFEKQQ